MFRPGQILISMAATIPINKIKEELQNTHVHVVRLLPNPPSTLGEGMNPVVFEKGAPPEVHQIVKEMLNIFGKFIEVNDEQMTWYVGLAGAAMRSVLPVLEGMTLAGIEAGLSPVEARRVAAQIFTGTAALLCRTELSFDQLKALTPMQTIDEQAVADIFVKAARQAKEKMDQAQTKLLS
jgi:pyrroline-5-carboxylate reductase